jgi:hypothetical protein
MPFLSKPPIPLSPMPSSMFIKPFENLSVE